MSTQERKQFSVRIPADLVDWADAYGASMRWDRTTVIVAALESFREDVGGGVPDAPKQRAENLAETAKGEVVKKDPAKPASFRAPVPPGVVRGSAVMRSRDGEPNVDHFEKTEDYRRAMAMWRAGDPRWESLRKKRES